MFIARLCQYPLPRLVIIIRYQPVSFTRICVDITSQEASESSTFWTDLCRFTSGFQSLHTSLCYSVQLCLEVVLREHLQCVRNDIFSKLDR